MAWGKISSVTGTGSGANLTTGTITASKFNEFNIYTTAFVAGKLRFNNDTGTNYARRYSGNGNSDVSTNINLGYIASLWDLAPAFIHGYIVNTSTKEKLIMLWTTETNNTIGAGTAPNRMEISAKWVNTSDAITEIDIDKTGTNFTTDENFTVLGSDLTPSAIIPAIPPLVKSLPSGSVGGWVELGRTTVPSGGATTVTVTGLEDKRYYMGLFYSDHSGSYTQPRLRVGDGSIATSGYGIRYHMYYSSTEQSGAQTDTGYPLWTSPTAPTFPVFGTFIIANKSDKNKLGICHSVGQQSAAATNAPERNEGVFTYNYTGGSIDQIQLFDAGGSNFAEGTQLVILGYDPADTHTTNFWEQLATASGAGSTLDTGTFTAKKYLWVQGYCKPSSSTGLTLNFNSDVSGNYAIRESINGGNDTLNTQQASSDNLTGTSTGGLYFNMFIINIAGQVKLWISDGQENADGVGTAGDRKEMAGKWYNTSDAITKIVCNANFGATSELKVWGSD